MSKQEPMLMESPLTQRVFVVTSYVDNGDGTFTARRKFDVTEQFDVLAAMRRGECELPKTKTNWERLFSTPERAARTWIEFNGIYSCADCPICHDEMGVTCEIPSECAWEDEEHGYDALLEWLRVDA